LAHAHANGVVHGDLSPGNIVFTAEGRPVLTDLGLARVLGEEAAGEVTPAYVDPTVARGGAPGPASDVFGVAAAAFHALTGIPPWNAAGPAETVAVALLAGVGTVAWAALRGAPGSGPAVAHPSSAASRAAVPTSAPVASSAPAVRTPTPSGPDGQERPGTPADWAALVGELYGRR